MDKAQTKETKEDKIRELVVAIFGFEPRPKQLEALVYVIAERKDLILTAKTYFVKILFLRQPPRKAVINICILPLNVTSEQVEKVEYLGVGPQLIKLMCHNLRDRFLHCLVTDEKALA